jgi:uncharacterized protein (DUF305 family)
MKPTAVIVAAGLALAYCTSADSTPRLSAPGNAIDRAFVSEMLEHHESGMYSAEIAQDQGRSTFVRAFADELLRVYVEDSAKLKERDAALARAGVKIGHLGLSDAASGSAHDAERLRTATPFDAGFLDVMIAHARGAIAITNAELAAGRDTELRRLALHIVDFQERQIARLHERTRSR